MIPNEVSSLIKRNKAYGNSHEKINESLQAVRKKLSENENLSQKESSTSQMNKEQKQQAIQNALNKALEEAMKLYNAIPRYVHAEALLHEVHCQTAITYVEYSDYTSFIALYLDYFISHPDDMINLNLVDLLTTLEDTIYASTGLNSNDKQQLILSLLADNQKLDAETFRSKALHQLKAGNKGICSETFASVAGVPEGGQLLRLQS